jgi:GMP synthase (glutamine-hydrolysing)
MSSPNLSGIDDAPTIVVVDFGGQYAHLIAQCVRGLGVFSRIVAPDRFEPDDVENLAGVILSGGPASVTDTAGPSLGFDPLGLAVPVLGICFGHQLLASRAGGTVARGKVGEYGLAEVHLDSDSRLFAGIPPHQRVWMSHQDSVTKLPEGYHATASSPNLTNAAFESDEKPIFGLQFHPEVHHTACGETVLDHFLGACGVSRSWDAGAQEQLVVEKTRRQAGQRDVFLLVSGGVDSLVTLAVCARALGPDRVQGLHVDTGFMRLSESDEVMRALGEIGVTRCRRVQASDRFFQALEGVVEPEEKRRILGRLFVEVVEAEMPKEGSWALGQGTIYPDTIESGGEASGSSYGAARIKTHHNRVDEIRRWILEGRVVEPLSDLYKHEVRALGARLGLPPGLLNRHPFPGPGLAVRLLCSATDEPEAGFDAEADTLDRLVRGSGYRAVILPVRSVGVQGDIRTFRHPVALWREDGKVALDWGELVGQPGSPQRPGGSPSGLATRITNNLRSVNRVVLWLGGTSPEKLKLGLQGLERATVDLLQRADAVATAAVAGLPEIWQMPVVLLPLFDEARRPSLVLRPVRSRDAMTADAFPMPARELEILEESLLRDLSGSGSPGPSASLGALFYDLTSKPPGTIEWE